MIRPGRQSGFTLIELMIALSLLTILVVKLTMVVDQASKTHQRESLAMALEDQAILVLDRVSFAIIGSDADTLLPEPEAPFFTPEIEYQVSLGVEDGEVVWSDPETIGLDADDPALLYWGKNKDALDERVVVWCRTVAEFMKDEILNGADDNLNGITDETGLSFVVDGDSVTIRLTLERMNKEGGPVRISKETTVTCRN
jgi:prepilin-type N-terminal cleavage/methylation domain-containing protein